MQTQWIECILKLAITKAFQGPRIPLYNDIIQRSQYLSLLQGTTVYDLNQNHAPAM